MCSRISLIEGNIFKKSQILLFALVLLGTGQAIGQVCSGIGHICSRTTDCCRGCCEGFQCVERSFSCSSDMGSIPGSNSCQNYFCPAGQICFLAPICPPENPCPPQPTCRSYSGSGYNYNYYNPWRNSSKKTNSAIHLLIASSSIVLIFWKI